MHSLIRGAWRSHISWARRLARQTNHMQWIIWCVNNRCFSLSLMPQGGAMPYPISFSVWFLCSPFESNVQWHFPPALNYHDSVNGSSASSQPHANLLDPFQQEFWSLRGFGLPWLRQLGNHISTASQPLSNSHSCQCSLWPQANALAFLIGSLDSQYPYFYFQIMTHH